MRLAGWTLLAAFLAATHAQANTVLDPTAPETMALYNLGTVPDVAAAYSNQVFYEGLAIAGNSLLLSVGDPATANQKVWSLPLIRVNNHIVGFGSASVYAPVLAYPGNCCIGNTTAGGLIDTGGDLLYTTQFFSYLGQHTGGNPGSSSLLDLASTGAATGGLQYVPANFSANGGGQLKMSSTCEPGGFGCSASGDWYTLNLGGSIGNYTLNSFTPYTVGVTALSFDYAQVDNTFTSPGVVLGDPSQLRLDYYALDTNGNPCNPNVTVSCAPIVHIAISDIQIGLGVVRDPVSGDFLFTTGNNEIFAVTDDLPEPSTVVLVGGALLLALRKRAATLLRS